MKYFFDEDIEKAITLNFKLNDAIFPIRKYTIAKLYTMWIKKLIDFSKIVVYEISKIKQM